MLILGCVVLVCRALCQVAQDLFIRTLPLRLLPDRDENNRLARANPLLSASPTAESKIDELREGREKA
jgi:hypothetical protein